MQFYWVRDCVWQGQFQIHWKKGSKNLADYFMKHHPPAHHKLMRPIYLNTHDQTGPTTPHEGVLITQPAMSGISSGIT